MQIVPVEKRGYDLIHEGALTFSEIHQNGIKMDVKHIKNEFKRHGKMLSQQEDYLDKFEEIKLWRKEYGNSFSIRSDDQLSDIIFNKLKYTPKKFTDSGNPSVDHEALQALNLEVADEILKYRKWYKIKNTYLKGLLKETCNGYLHPFMNLHTARTMRSSSRFPNVQNQPTRDPEAGEVIRKGFISRKNHYLVAADYGGIEVKGSQWHTNDPTMYEYLSNPESADMHSDFCALLFKLPDIDQSIAGEKLLRKATKNGFTFPQFYGDYYGNNAVSLWEWVQFRGSKINPKKGPIIRGDVHLGKHLINKGIKNFKQFENHVKNIEKDMWENRFPVYKKWRDNQYKFYLNNGFVTILTGFVCQGVMGRNETINYPIQGACFHCLLRSTIELQKALKKKNMKTKIIFQVHDEIIADVPKEEYDDYLELLKEIMVHDLRKNWTFINVPMEIEVEASELNGTWFNMDKVLTYIN